MKILILASNPRKDLNLEEEIRQLQGVIEHSKNRENLEVEVGFAVRSEDLQGLLLKHEPDIVHFCGHGTGQQGLVFGLETLVSTDGLSDLFRLCSRWVKCVLLNACYSEVQADAIVQHIDYAIGMNHEIRDDAAIAFARGFYQALGYAQPIEQSYEFGCNAIQLQISGNSNFRSTLSEERRKFEVASTVERVVIPEHLKPVLKIKPNLTTSVSNSTSDASENVLPSTKRDIQLSIDKALEQEIALRQDHQEFKQYLAEKNIRYNSNSSSPKKTRKLFVGGTVTTLALVLTSFLFYHPSQLEQDRVNQPPENSVPKTTFLLGTTNDFADIVLHKDPDAQGQKLGINSPGGDEINIGLFPYGSLTTFNDTVSSITVNEGEWQFFTDAGLGGNTGNLAPGVTYNLGENDDAITSIRRIK